MTKKVFHGVHATLLLIAAMFFTACAEDVVVEKANQKTDADYEGLTCFAAEAPEATRTSMYRNGRFAWVNRGDTVDHVWVVKDNVPILSKAMTITSDSSTLAKFYMEGDFTENQYSVLYAGTVVGETMPTAVPDVTIPAQQVQRTANNSEHFGISGDCGIATAKKNGSKYSFTLGHEMAYLMFEPRVDETSDVTSTILKKITIKEKNGKNIRGKFELSGTGATLKETGGDQIEVICGEDVLPVDAGTMKHSQAKNYGFAINYTDYTPYGKTKVTDGEDVEEKANSRVFMVIKPTVAADPYTLIVTYEFATGATQNADHDHGGEQWDMGYIYTWTTTEREVEFAPEKNKFYRLRHKLKITTTSTALKYPFEEYYMWGAQDWFWKAAETAGQSYPVYNDEHQTEYAPTVGSTSWFSDVYEDNKMIAVASFSNFKWRDRDATSSTSKARIRSGKRRKVASGGEWDNVLTANQMSFYVVYGDPYYDSEKEWILEGYNGVETVCRGGVWIKKKEKIREYLQTLSYAYPIVYPATDEIDENSNNTEKSPKYSAPFPSAAYKKTRSVSNKESEYLSMINGRQYNLYYMAPPMNYRMPYTNWDAANSKFRDGVHKPSDDGKNDDDYFFVPCLGRFEYSNDQTTLNGAFAYHYRDYVEGEEGEEGEEVIVEKVVPFDNIEGTGDPTLTLVGAQGFYWTKTPVTFAHGDTKFYKYVYDEYSEGGNTTPATLLSEYSNFDRFAYERDDVESYDPEKLYFDVTTPNSHLLAAYRYKMYSETGNHRWNHYNDNAFYLNLHYHYIALSWQQHSIYTKTGMRLATIGYDGAEGMFE